MAEDKILEGRKVKSLHLASNGSYVSHDDMTITWLAVGADENWSLDGTSGGQRYEPWVRWDNPDGTVDMVNLRHVERITLAVPDDGGEE